jgi:RNA 2',3'-cyclic 3'-phosphodiesterase
MHRLFTAIIPPAPIRTQLVDIMGGVENARWQRENQLHITLRYIGKVDRHTAEDVDLALQSITAAPLSLHFQGLGEFDRKGRTDQLWAGVLPRDGITALHQKIDQALQRAGLPAETRQYRPHCTLARFSQSAEIRHFIAQNNDLRTGEFVATSFALVESHLGKGGANYELVAQYPLTAKTQE